MRPREGVFPRWTQLRRTKAGTRMSSATKQVADGVGQGPENPLWTRKPSRGQSHRGNVGEQGWHLLPEELSNTQSLSPGAPHWVISASLRNPLGHQPKEEMPAVLGRMVPPEMCVPLEPQNGRKGLCRCSQLRAKRRSSWIR